MLARPRFVVRKSPLARAQRVCPLGRSSSHLVWWPLAILRTSSRLLGIAFLFAGILSCDLLFSREVPCVIAREKSSYIENGTVAAARFTGQPDAQGFPAETAWKSASPVQFDHDWQGKNADPQRSTEVRLLWNKDNLFLRLAVRYRVITVFPDAEPSGHRDELWERDVAEVFLQPPGSAARSYKEFEVSPNGYWIDLDIAPGEKHDLQSGLMRRVTIDEKNKMWTAELALPMKSLTADFDPAAAWRVNFYRVEGAAEPRFYSAWQPTGTPTPNFHVPEAFGKLIFDN
ncbi:MAG: carbohydrate-binding family 9-like protein [Candidatus Acidiferrum sp.]